jgi:hypothetical protein
MLQGAKELENLTWIVCVPLRGHRQGLVEGAAAVRARPVEPGHDPRRLAGVALQQLDDRRRASHGPFRGGRDARSLERHYVLFGRCKLTRRKGIVVSPGARASLACCW